MCGFEIKQLSPAAAEDRIHFCATYSTHVGFSRQRRFCVEYRLEPLIYSICHYRDQ